MLIRFLDLTLPDRMRMLWNVGFLLSILMLFLSIQPAGTEERKSMSSMAQADLFSSPFDVPHGYSAKTSFSPEVSPDFRGIRISALEMVRIGADRTVKIPISMTTQFTAAYLMKFDAITHHMAVVAVNGKTGASLTGTLQEDDAAVPLLEDRGSDSLELEQTIFESYLTFDLARFLHIPAETAVYHVHVTLEQYQSNVVAIKIQKLGK